MYVVCKRKFSFTITTSAMRIILITLPLLIVSFISFKLSGYSIYRYTIGCVLLVSTWLISLKMLNGMIPLKDILHGIKNKIRR